MASSALGGLRRPTSAGPSQPPACSAASDQNTVGRPAHPQGLGCPRPARPVHLGVSVTRKAVGPGDGDLSSPTRHGSPSAELWPLTGGGGGEWGGRGGSGRPCSGRPALCPFTPPLRGWQPTTMGEPSRVPNEGAAQEPGSCRPPAVCWGHKYFEEVFILGVKRPPGLEAA